MTNLRLYLYLLLVNLASCFGRQKPNIALIDKDLGIKIPQHTLSRADSDPFGLGADAKITIVFQFDSSNFAELEQEVSHSFLFNEASKDRFEVMALPERIRIMHLLAEHGITGYWIKSDSAFLFDGDSILSNPSDNVFQYLPSRHIFLPNQDSTRVWNGFALDVYTVKAIIDRKRRTLYYRNVHI